MERSSAYRVLCGALAALALLAGIAAELTGFRALLPGGEVAGPMPLGPAGIYFLAFTGAALVGWGGSLIAAARQPEATRSVGTATAVALVLAALFRMWAWFHGDYAFLGDLPRGEAALFLLLALALVWLRPPRTAAAA